MHGDVECPLVRNADLLSNLVATRGEGMMAAHALYSPNRQRTAVQNWLRRGCRVAENLSRFSLLGTAGLLILLGFLNFCLIWM